MMRFFILFSALLHVALIYYVSSFEPPLQLHATGGGGEPLQITLTAPSARTATVAEQAQEITGDATPPQPLPHPAISDTVATTEPDLRPHLTTPPPAENAAEIAPHKIAVKPQSNQVVAAETAVTETATTRPPQLPRDVLVVENSTTTADGSYSARVAVGSEIQRQLKQALIPHFRYPRLARKRGWQGTVKLGLHIAADGRLSNIQVMQSSGYRLLDRAAIESLQRLERLPGSWKWLQDGRDETIPIRYALVDG